MVPEMELLRDAWRLLQVWRRQDRIRGAPSVGRLLNLPLGVRLMIRDEILQVEKHDVRLGESVAAANYTLKDISESYTASVKLLVYVLTEQPAEGTIVYQRDSTTMELSSDEVTVLGLRK